MSTDHTIIFTGPAGAGKTTAISSVSDIPVVSTTEAPSEVILDLGLDLAGGAAAVMDYGLMHLGNGERIHLFATPGEERFDFMWDVLLSGAIGVILLIDNGRKDALEDLDFFLEAFADLIAKNRAVIGVTRMDENPIPIIATYNQRLESARARLPVFDLDPRNRGDVRTALRALLYQQDPGLMNTAGM